MGRVALLGWECGGGRGHVVTLTLIARRLRALGWECLLALPRAGMSAGLDTGEFPSVEVPSWGDGVGEPLHRPGSSATMADILAEIGLRSEAKTRAQIEHWLSLLAKYGPDIVIADFAPGAVLAARGRVACLAVGTGYAIPPPGLPRLPLLHRTAPPVFDESDIVETVNAALLATGTRPIDRLVEALAGDDQAVCTLPLLDPYAFERTDPVLGPLLSDPVVPRDPRADETFCYLRAPRRLNRMELVSSALVGLPTRTVTYLPDLDPHARDALRARGVDVRDAPVPLTEQLRRSRLVVHFGGHGIAASALLAGVPQIVLNFDVEKWMIARALCDAGVARRYAFVSAPPTEIQAGIQAAFADSAMASAAERVALDHDIYRSRDVAGEIAARCERLAA